MQDSNEGYGLCQDTYCEEPTEDTLLIDGRCGICNNDYWDEKEFGHQNQFDLYDEDYGQTPYGRYYS